MAASGNQSGVEHPDNSSAYIVLEVGSEGGGYTIVCNGSAVAPTYRRLSETGERSFFEDEDPLSSPPPLASHGDAAVSSLDQERYPWVNSLAEALQEINRGWPRLDPIFVHPAHRAEIRDIWLQKSRSSETRNARAERVRAQWLRLLEESPSSLDSEVGPKSPTAAPRPGNKVAPDGSLFDVRVRLKLMGNRGTLKVQNGQYVTPGGFRPWIHCVTNTSEIRNYKPHDVKYTKLFFTDEATALSAGHRPCGYCLSSRLEEFKKAWFSANRNLLEDVPETLDVIDRTLHRERMSTLKRGALTARLWDLPDGTFYRLDGEFYLSWNGFAVVWHQGNYVSATRPPEVAELQLLTPLSLLKMYSAGWKPRVSDSAKKLARDAGDAASKG